MHKPVIMELSTDRFHDAYTTPDIEKIEHPTLVIRSRKGKKSIALKWYGKIDGERIEKPVLFPVLEKQSPIPFPISLYEVESVCQIRNWVNSDERMSLSKFVNASSYNTWVVRAFCTSVANVGEDGRVYIHTMISAISGFFLDDGRVVKPEPYFDAMFEFRNKAMMDDSLKLFDNPKSFYCTKLISDDETEESEYIWAYIKKLPNTEQ